MYNLAPLWRVGEMIVKAGMVAQYHQNCVRVEPFCIIISLATTS